MRKRFPSVSENRNEVDGDEGRPTRADRVTRYCLLGRVDPDRIAEYRRVHAQVWPELLEVLRDAGWRNYSLFLTGDGLLIGYVEAVDLDRAQAEVARTEVNARWQAAMAELFASDGPPDEQWELVDEVFHLEDQLRAAGLPAGPARPT